jgi:hypothetical protein
MSFIDWSDHEEMLGLLAEYVADESLAEREDRARAKFLGALSSKLTALATMAEELPAAEAIERLRDIYDSQPSEFVTDAALTHLDDCIQELERIVAQTGGTAAR